MATIELLEDRVSNLEKQIYGLEKAATVDDTLPENSIVDSLVHANTLISSALSGRDKMSAIVKRLPELNDYLDPAFEESELPTEAKLLLLLTMEPEIRENYKLLMKMQELIPVLESKHTSDMPNLTTKLNKLSLISLKANDELEMLSSDVHKLVSKYNDVITSISKSLITFDSVVSAAELAAMPKKQLD